jgi:hypothetical protein
MYTEQELAEYMTEIREQVCRRCIERPPGGPPCGPLGKLCGIEVNLPRLIDAVRSIHSRAMDLYIIEFHDRVCEECVASPTSQCPCPLKYLLELAVEAIETVDERKAALRRPK